MHLKQGGKDFPQRREAAGAEPQFWQVRGRQMLPMGPERSFDPCYDGFRLLAATMRDEPARRFRQPQAHQQNDKPEQGADEKRQPPPQVYGE